MKKLTLYKRVSTDSQTGEERDGLQRQQRSFDHFLQTFPDVNSYQVETISDEGLSAYHAVNLTSKGGLGSYIARVEAGEIEPGSVLVCEEQSRLTRIGHRDALRMIWALDEHGISVWSIKENRIISADDFISDLMFFLNAKGAHDYSAEIARKVGLAKKRKQHEVRIEGKGTFGNVCPYWLKPTADGFEQIPEHVQTVRRIFAERFKLVSMAAIAAGLNADNIPLMTARNWKKKAAPTGWTQSTIKNILSNESVIGTLPASKSKQANYPAVKGYYGDPVIPLEHWIAAQESMSQKGKKATRNESNPYAVRLFKSLIICKFCGHRMDVNGARGALSSRGTPFKGSLICRSARENACMHGTDENGKPCRTPSLPMRIIEDALTVNLFRLLKQRDVSTGAAERIAMLERDIKEIQEMIEQNSADLKTVRNQNARSAILSALDELGEQLDTRKAELDSEQRKQQATTLETLDGLNLDDLDGRLEAQRVISKNIRQISVDTVSKRCDVLLSNGNLIEGFSLEESADRTGLMQVALHGDAERDREFEEITGQKIPSVFPLP